MAIYVGILGVLIIIAGIFFSRPSDKKVDLQKLIYGVCFVIAGVALLFWSSITRISDGYIGIIKLNGKAQAQPETLNSGWHLVTPLAKVIQLDIHTQYDKIVKKESRTHKISNDTLKIVSADGSVIKLGLTIVYHLIPSEAAALYNEAGPDYKYNLVRPLSLSVANRNAQTYGTSSLNADNWNELQSNINKDIKREFWRHGLQVEKVMVNNFTPYNTNRNLAERNEILLAKADDKVASKTHDIPAHTISLHFAAKKAETKNKPVNILPEEVAISEPKPSIKIIIKDDYTEEVNGLIDNKNDPARIKTRSVVSMREENSIAHSDNNETNSNDCAPMDDKSFGSAKQMILSTSNNTYKMLTTAEKVVTTNCFTSEQVSDFVKMLPTEDSKLEFAKQAYLRTVDRNEFYVKVAGNFDKKSKKQLGRYILHLIHRYRWGAKPNNDVRAGLINEENDLLAGVMDNKTFEYFKEMVSSSNGKDKKLAVATKIINSHFLTSDQVLEIIKLFPEVETRLEFAKEAFTRTADKRRFVKVADYFDKSTRKMLDDYVITLYASK